VTFLLRQGRVIGPSSTRVADVLVRDGRIVEIAERIDAPRERPKSMPRAAGWTGFGGLARALTRTRRRGGRDY